MRKSITGPDALGLPFPFVAGFTAFCAIGIGFPGMAAPASPASPSSIAQRSDSQVTRLYVNPLSGNDDRTSGNALSPLRTITYALEVAQPNTAILLAPGTYSTQTGESFPVRLKPGVTIQGNPETRGEGIVISGGGQIDRLHVAIVAADGAGLVGVTVTNDRGYGVWIESASPSILNNTFTGNRQDAVAIAGSGSPMVRGNQFVENYASGMSVAGTSAADIRENTFKGADVGVAIADNARPLVMSNQMTHNTDGVAIRQNAQPTLRGNVITHNQRYGAIVRDLAQPNFGTPDDPGGNTLRHNQKNDLENAAQQRVQAFGNELDADRTAGAVDLTAETPPVLARANGSSAAPTVPVRDFGQALSSRPAIGSVTAASAPQSPTRGSRRAIALSAAAPEMALERVSSGEALPQPPAIAAIPSGVVPPIPTRATDGRPSVTELVPSLGALRVPDADIPIGDAGEESFVALEPPSQTSSLRPSAANLRYRVLVVARSVRERAAIRAIAPDAFSTFVNAREVVQAGTFSEREPAQSLVEQLQGLGLPATLEDRDNPLNN